jgi:hypothetical protein
LGSLSYTTLDGIHLSSWADVGGKLVAVTPRLPPRRAVAVFNTPLRVGLVLDIHSVHLHDVVVVDVHDLVVARPDDLDDARRVPLPTPASLDALSFLVHHLCQQHFRFTFSNCKRSSGDSESIIPRVASGDTKKESGSDSDSNKNCSNRNKNCSDKLFDTNSGDLYRNLGILVGPDHTLPRKSKYPQPRLRLGWGYLLFLGGYSPDPPLTTDEERLRMRI